MYQLHTGGRGEVDLINWPLSKKDWPLVPRAEKILNEAQRAEFKLKGIHYFREK